MFFKRTWINPQILGIFGVKIHKCVLWASALKKGRGIKSLFSTICNMFTFAYLLLNFVGVAMKWWAMTTQMTRISNVGITKFVTLAQTTQVFWKEGHLPSYIMYANFPIRSKQSFSVSFLSSPFTELTELLTSSIGKKHLHPDLPLQLRWMVVLNIMGTTGRRARAQQTRIIRKQLTCKQHWTIVKQDRTIIK